MDALLGASLVASYLVNRKILDDGHIFGLVQRRSLPDVLDGGLRVTRRFLGGLAERFNGDVFGPVPEALAQVDDADLHMVAALLRPLDRVLCGGPWTRSSTGHWTGSSTGAGARTW